MSTISPAHAALGAAVRRRRLELGLSQIALSEAIGAHHNYVGYVERGEQNVTLTYLLRLAAALSRPAADLVAEAEAAGL